MTAQGEPDPAAQLEQAGNALAAAGEPSADSYRQAQRLLMPAGALWTGREEYDARMQAFERLQQKPYALSPDGRPRGSERPGPAAGREAAANLAPVHPGQAKAPALPAWQVLARQGRLRDAAALLRP